MIKAFISHSSKQKKEFVEPLVELLGRDSCIIDCFPQSPNVGRVISEFKFKQKIISSRYSYREDC